MLPSARSGAAADVFPRDHGSWFRGRTGWSVLLDVVASAVVWAAGAAVFFRAQLASGFDQIMGDDGDSRLIIYLCEHWYLLLRGQGTWRSPAFFYPIKGLLGWSDCFVLYEIFYAPLRLVGCDPFLAFQLTLVLLSAMGFASFVVLVRLAFGAPRVVALLGALVFTFSNTLWLHVNSPQLLGIYFVPLILVVGLLSWRSLPAHPGRAALLAAVVGLSWALLFYTTYYVAWFALLAAGVIIVLLVVAGRWAFVTGAASALRAEWRTAAAAVGGFVVGIVPFGLTYLPVLSQTGGLSYAQTLRYAPRWQDLADVGPGNLWWSGLVHHLVSPAVLAPYEVTFAVTPLLLVTAVVGAVLASWRLRRVGARHTGAARSAGILAATALILYVLPVRTSHGSLWALIWHIPGATAIRAIDRLQVVTGLALSLALVAAATELAGPSAARQLVRPEGGGRWARLRPAGLVLLLLVVVEQFNTTPKSLIDRPVQLALLRSAVPPPARCRSFFVVDSGPGRLRYFEYQVDAMLVSQRLAIPTLNGYTAHNPAGWHLDYLHQPGYRKRVADWANGHGVGRGLCQLDLATMRWAADPGLQR